MDKGIGKVAAFANWLEEASNDIKKAHNIALKWTCNRADNPALSGVKYANGYMVATDRHRILRITLPEAQPEEIIINKRGESLEGLFPDLERLIPEPSEANGSVGIDTHDKDLIATLQAIIATTKHINGMTPILVRVTMDSITITPAEEAARMKIIYKGKNLYTSPELFPSFSFMLNAQYFLDTILDFKRLKNSAITIHQVAPHRPLLIKGEINNKLDMTAVIQPIVMD